MRNEYAYRVVITKRPGDGQPGGMVPEENLPEWQRKESGGFFSNLARWPWRRRFLTRSAADRKLWWHVERGCEGYVQMGRIEWLRPDLMAVQDPDHPGQGTWVPFVEPEPEPVDDDQLVIDDELIEEEA